MNVSVAIVRRILETIGFEVDTTAPTSVVGVAFCQTSLASIAVPVVWAMRIAVLLAVPTSPVPEPVTSVKQMPNILTKQ